MSYAISSERQDQAGPVEANRRKSLKSEFRRVPPHGAANSAGIGSRNQKKWSGYGHISCGIQVFIRHRRRLRDRVNTPLNDVASRVHVVVMKKHSCRFASLLIPVVASLTLSSCVVPVVDGTQYPSSGGGHMVYTTLPTTFVGSAYYHQGRYYSGGNYQTGRYRYDGRVYDQRYSHNGRYYYGGRYQQHQARGGVRDQHPDPRRANQRNAIHRP